MVAQPALAVPVGKSLPGKATGLQRHPEEGYLISHRLPFYGWRWLPSSGIRCFYKALPRNSASGFIWGGNLLHPKEFSRPTSFLWEV